MSLKPHENIRVQVIGLLKRILKSVAREKCSAFRDLTSCTLWKLLEEYEESVTILMPQEVRVGAERRWIDMALGSSIVFEFKAHEGEFDDAERDARVKYWPLVSKAKFFIVTNWLRWRIYRVSTSGLELVEECDKERAEKLLETQIIQQLKEIKIPPIPQNVETLYKLNYEQIREKLARALDALKGSPKVKPLYEAYKSIMGMLYSESSKSTETLFEDLFIRHTYMQMSVLASLAAALGIIESPEVICSGAFLRADTAVLDIALPYLNWWRAALYEPSLRGDIEEVLDVVIRRANMVDWSLGAEDVFRMLYEYLIERDVRREIGEYYTPLWLVELMLNEFDLRERIVLDPFCGSGTFLVKALHRKIDLGEDPDKALNELVGFDVNPLAVAVARAELILAYWRRTGGRIPSEPPHVYHIDTLATWFGGSILTVPPLSGIANTIASHLQTLVNFNQVRLGSASSILAMLRVLEKNLTLALWFAYSECGFDSICLEKKIETYVERGLEKVRDPFIQSFVNLFKERRLAQSLAHIIADYGGDSVWAVVLISIFAAILMTRFKPDIVVTNPPWIPVTEFKAPYADRVREYMLSKIRSTVGTEKSGQVLAGADIAAAALGKSVELSTEGVAYIMNREQLFYHKSPMLAGILATYLILRDVLENVNAKIKLIDFDFDVFEHGVYPAVIVVKKRWGSTL